MPVYGRDQGDIERRKERLYLNLTGGFTSDLHCRSKSDRASRGDKRAQQVSLMQSVAAPHPACLDGQGTGSGSCRIFCCSNPLPFGSLRSASSAGRCQTIKDRYACFCLSLIDNRKPELQQLLPFTHGKFFARCKMIQRRIASQHFCIVRIFHAAK